MNTTNDVRMPSGSEVESAVLHPPVSSLQRSGFRGRLDAWKSRGVAKVHDLQHLASERGVAIRHGAKSQVTKVEDSMRTQPMLWAGIAAGTGFALGMIGRIASWRNKQRRAMPDLVIIETGC